MADVAAEETTNLGAVVAAVSFGTVVLLLFILSRLKSRDKASDETSAEREQKPSETKLDKQNGVNGTTKKTKGGKKRLGSASGSGPGQVQSNRRQFAVLKGHTSDVYDLDFSLNGKCLASVSQDRTIRLWSVKDFKEKEHKYVRANIDFDHATKVNFSPDSSLLAVPIDEDIVSGTRPGLHTSPFYKHEDLSQSSHPLRFRAFITALANGNTIRVFKVNKKKDGSGMTVTGEFDFPVKHKAEIINLAVSSNGKFIMSCSRDTTIIIWDLKGEVLSILDTRQMNNSFAAISPCGRFVASAGFTPDVKLWEVEFTKSDSFNKVSRAMDLKGHTAGVHHFSFSADSSRMATVSKDGTWKIWDIDVEYTKKQDPHLLMTGIYDASCAVYNNMLIAMSPDAYVTAIAMGRSIGLFNTENGSLEEFLEDVHGDEVTSVAWHPSSRYLATAGGADKHIRVWHNAAGLKVQIDDLQGKLYRSKSDTIKTRIEQQILEARASLDKLNI